MSSCKFSVKQMQRTSQHFLEISSRHIYIHTGKRPNTCNELDSICTKHAWHVKILTGKQPDKCSGLGEGLTGAFSCVGRDNPTYNQSRDYQQKRNDFIWSFTREYLFKGHGKHMSYRLHYMELSIQWPTSSVVYAKHTYIWITPGISIINTMNCTNSSLDPTWL